MPVYLRKNVNFTPKSLDEFPEDTEGGFLVDPDQHRDALPQPYRMIDKTINKLLDDSWEIIASREQNRVEEAAKIRPAQYECAVAVPELSTATCMAGSPDGQVVVIGMTNGLAALDVASNGMLGTWDQDDMHITQLNIAQMSRDIYMVCTICDLGMARVFALAGGRFYLLETANEQEGSAKLLASKCESSATGNFYGVYVEISANNDHDDVTEQAAHGTEGVLEIHKVPHDVWLKEIEALVAKTSPIKPAVSQDQLAQKPATPTESEAAPESSDPVEGAGTNGQEETPGSQQSSKPRRSRHDSRRKSSMITETVTLPETVEGQQSHLIDQESMIDVVYTEDETPVRRSLHGISEAVRFGQVRCRESSEEGQSWEGLSEVAIPVYVPALTAKPNKSGDELKQRLSVKSVIAGEEIASELVAGKNALSQNVDQSQHKSENITQQIHVSAKDDKHMISQDYGAFEEDRPSVSRPNQISRASENPSNMGISSHMTLSSSTERGQQKPRPSEVEMRRKSRSRGSPASPLISSARHPADVNSTGNAGESVLSCSIKAVVYAAVSHRNSDTQSGNVDNAESSHVAATAKVTIKPGDHNLNDAGPSRLTASAKVGAKSGNHMEKEPQHSDVTQSVLRDQSHAKNKFSDKLARKADNLPKSKQNDDRKGTTLSAGVKAVEVPSSEVTKEKKSMKYSNDDGELHMKLMDETSSNAGKMKVGRKINPSPHNLSRKSVVGAPQAVYATKSSISPNISQQPPKRADSAGSRSPSVSRNSSRASGQNSANATGRASAKRPSVSPSSGRERSSSRQSRPASTRAKSGRKGRFGNQLTLDSTPRGRTSPQAKFSPSSVVLKVKPPGPVSGVVWSSPLALLKTVDNGDVIGTGVNHQISQQHLEQRLEVFKNLHQQHWQFVPTEENTSRQPTFHFLTPGRMLPHGIDNAAIGGVGQATSVAIWWNNHNLLCHYALHKTYKAAVIEDRRSSVIPSRAGLSRAERAGSRSMRKTSTFTKITQDLEHKPDVVWPQSATIVTSAVSACTSLIAVGLQGGLLVVWDKYIGMHRRVIQVCEETEIHQLTFLDASICPQDDMAYPLYQTKTNIYVLVWCTNGKLFLVNCGLGCRDPPQDVSAELEKESDNYTKVISLTGTPELVVTVRQSGELYLHDILTGKVLCEVNLPETHVIQLPWEPTITALANGQMLYVKGTAKDSVAEVEENQNSTPVHGVFVFQLRSFPTLDRYRDIQRPEVPAVIHSTIERRAKAVLQERLSVQSLRKVEMQERWGLMKDELSSMKQARNMGSARLHTQFSMNSIERSILNSASPGKGM